VPLACADFDSVCCGRGAIAAALHDQQDDQHHLGYLVSDSHRVVLALDQSEIRNDRRGRQRDQSPAGQPPEPGEGRVVKGRGRHDVREAIEIEQRGEEPERGRADGRGRRLGSPPSRG
jgi:hypothetical protein